MGYQKSFPSTAISLFILCAGLAAISARGNTWVWTGGGGVNAYWNNSANWGSAGIPGNGDSVIFQGAAGLVNTNNIANLTLGQVRFPSGGFDIRGNPFTLTNSIIATNTSGANIIENNITLATTPSALIIVSNGVTLTLDGSLSGSGVGVNKTGLGTLLYQTSGINSYTGATLVSAGALEFNVGGVNAVSGPLIIGDGTGNGSPTVADLQGYEMASLPSVTINTNGTLNLNNFNEPLFSTNLMMNSGMILTGTSGQLSLLPNSTITVSNIGFSYSFIVGNLIGPFNGNLNTGSGTLTIQGNGGLGIEAVTSGSANIVQNGAVTVEWYGPGSYSGNYTANDSSVVFLADSQALGNVTNQMTLNGTSYVEVVDEINLTNQSLTINSSGYFGQTIIVYGNTTNSWAANFVLNTLCFVDVEPSCGFNMIGPISGSGGLTKSASGYLELSGSSANTYASTTTVSGGTLLLGKSSGIIAVPSPLVIGSGTTVRLLNNFQIGSFSTPVTMADSSLLDMNTFTEVVGPISMQGAQIWANGSLYFGAGLTVNASTVAPSVISGTCSIYGSIMTITNTGHNFSPDLVISANLFSGGITNGLIKAGAGEVNLSGNNSFTGPVTINGGNLWAQTSTALGATNAPVTVNNGGSLFLYGTGLDFGLKPLVLSGNGYAFGALSCQGSSSWEGDVTLTNYSTLYVFTNSLLTLAGTISGPGGFTKAGPGTNTLTGTGNNPYLGSVFVNDGILNLSKTGGWSIGYGPIIIGDGIGGPGSAVVREFTSNQIFYIPVTINSDGLLDLNGQNDLVGTYVTLNGGANIQNTSAGTLSLLDGTTLTVNSGNSTISGNLNVGDTNTTCLWTNNGYSLIMNASVVGGANIAISGAGTTYLNASNSYNGLTVVQQGFVYAQNNFALGTTNNGTVVSNGASLVLQGNIGITNESLTLNGHGDGSLYGALDVENGTNAWAGPITLNSNSTFDAWNPGSALRINGPITGPGGPEFFGYSGGGGTHFFDGTLANTYAGPTTVDAGCTLLLNKSPVNHAIPGNNLLVTGTVQLLNDDQMDWSTEVNIQNSGQVLLNTHYCYMDGISGTGKFDLGSVWAAIGWSYGTSSFGGTISGSGSLYSSGNITLSGNNTYTGTTYIYVNKLVINGSQPQSPVSVTYVGGTLGGTGTVGTIQANGTVAPGNNVGTLNSSNVTFSSTGTFTVELNGTNAGTSYSQLNVTGTVALASATLQVVPGTVGATNNHYTIINNDGIDAVSGTFAGLPEGATVVASDGAQFTVSYHGGTGNDVVLTQTSLPTKPKLTGIQNLGGGGIQLNGIGLTNLSYTVWANTNLATTNWITIGTAPAVGTNVQFIDLNAANFKQRFYRFSWP